MHIHQQERLPRVVHGVQRSSSPGETSPCEPPRGRRTSSPQRKRRDFLESGGRTVKRRRSAAGANTSARRRRDINNNSIRYRRHHRRRRCREWRSDHDYPWLKGRVCSEGRARHEGVREFPPRWCYVSRCARRLCTVCDVLCKNKKTQNPFSKADKKAPSASIQSSNTTA